MDESPRDERLGSLTRGVFIGVLMVGYGWFGRQPQASFTEMFVVGALLQTLIIVVRRFVPAESQALAQYVFELVADGATVLMFALGVFGGIASLAAAA